MNASHNDSANELVISLSKLLGIEIDDSMLQLCVKLLDQGVDPEVLAKSISNIRNETESAMI